MDRNLKEFNFFIELRIGCEHDVLSRRAYEDYNPRYTKAEVSMELIGRRTVTKEQSQNTL